MSSERQRLWVVTECYSPDLVPTGQCLTHAAEGLADELDVNVICGRPDLISRGIRVANRETWRNVKIFRVWSTRLNKNLMINRIANTVTLGVSVFLRSLRSFRKGDRILAATAPVHLPFTAAVASLIKGGSYALLIQHYYPDHFVAIGKLKQNSILVKAIHFANAWLFKHAARIIVVGRDMTEIVSARTDGLGIPIKTIPNLADTDEILNQRTAVQTKVTFDIALEQFRKALR